LRSLNGVKDSKGHTTQSPLLTNNLVCQVHPHLFCVTNVELEERDKYWHKPEERAGHWQGGLLSGAFSRLRAGEKTIN
jgi:hypothetical protein